MVSLSGYSQSFEIIARANSSQSVISTFGQSLALRSFLVDYESSNMALGIEVSANHWQTRDRFNELYLSVEPFVSILGEVGIFNSYINWGPSISFGFSDNRPEQSNKADLGFFQCAGLRYNKWVFEYHYRIGIREYTYTNGLERFTRLGLGVGYKF